MTAPDACPGCCNPARIEALAMVLGALATALDEVQREELRDRVRGLADTCSPRMLSALLLLAGDVPNSDPENQLERRIFNF